MALAVCKKQMRAGLVELDSMKMIWHGILCNITIFF